MGGGGGPRSNLPPFAVANIDTFQNGINPITDIYLTKQMPVIVY